MEHEQAVQEMAVERYLLDELAPELREAFEEHLFDCAECSLDLRAGAAFVEEARVQLPSLAASAPATASRSRSRQSGWLAWLRPEVAVPAFAALLAVIAFQNFSTIPSLRSAGREPRLTPWVTFHTDTRGDKHLVVPADPKQARSF